MGGPNNIETAFKLAVHIFRDLYTLNPEAWVYWRVVENKIHNGWGLIHVDFNNPKEITILKQYWIMMHFTKTLKENDNYTFLNKNILQIKNINGKYAYIIIGNYNLSSFTHLHVNQVRITDETRNYDLLNSLPSYLSKFSIVSFYLTNQLQRLPI